MRSNTFVPEVGGRQSKPTQLAWYPDRAPGNRFGTGSDRDVSGTADTA